MQLDLSEEELSVLGFVLWEKDNDLAMMPPNTYDTQSRDTRIVAQLNDRVDRIRADKAAARERALEETLFNLLDPVLVPTDVFHEVYPEGTNVMAMLVKAVREHDNPTPMPPTGDGTW